MKRLFHWIDAFSDKPFAGNGCMVVHDAGDVAPDQCMALVRETSLTECTFLEPSEVADVKVRYFLAEREVDFAGHPTIASVLAWLDHYGAEQSRVTLETGAGVIPVRIEDDRVVISLPTPAFGPKIDPGEVAEVFGLGANDIVGEPGLVSVGLGHTIAVVRSLDALRKAKADRSKLIDYCHRHTWAGTAEAPAPFLVLLGGIEKGGTFSRLLLEAGPAEEDAFTGSATAEAAAYLWREGFIDSPTYTAEQGHWMGRPGEAQVRVIGARDAIERVEIAGKGAILMRGEVDL